MQLPIKKKWLVTFAIILIFILLNPTIRDFQDYKGLSKTKTVGIRKKFNFLVCTIYEYHDTYYLGILKNFSVIKE